MGPRFVFRSVITGVVIIYHCINSCNSSSNRSGGSGSRISSCDTGNGISGRSCVGSFSKGESSSKSGIESRSGGNSSSCSSSGGSSSDIGSGGSSG